MLQKVFIYNHTSTRVEIYYLDVKNYTFDPEKVYDLHFHQTKIPDILFEKIKSCILNNLHFPQTEFYPDVDYDIQVGRLVVGNVEE